MNEMSTGELQIAERAMKHKGEALHSLHHFIDVALLEESYKQLNKNSSAGVDGENWYEFGILAKESIPELLSKFKAGEYRALKIRRVYIPKGDGVQRSLGINILINEWLPLIRPNIYHSFLIAKPILEEPYTGKPHAAFYVAEAGNMICKGCVRQS